MSVLNFSKGWEVCLCRVSSVQCEGLSLSSSTHVNSQAWPLASLRQRQADPQLASQPASAASARFSETLSENVTWEVNREDIWLLPYIGAYRVHSTTKFTCISLSHTYTHVSHTCITYIIYMHHTCITHTSNSSHTSNASHTSQIRITRTCITHIHYTHALHTCITTTSHTHGWHTHAWHIHASHITECIACMHHNHVSHTCIIHTYTCNTHITHTHASHSHTLQEWSHLCCSGALCRGAAWRWVDQASHKPFKLVCQRSEEHPLLVLLKVPAC